MINTHKHLTTLITPYLTSFLMLLAFTTAEAAEANNEASKKAVQNTSLATVTSMYQPPLANMPMNQIVDGELLPQLDYFFEKLVAEKDKMVVDGVSVFTAKDLFMPGKIALSMSYLLVNTPPDDPKFKRYLSGYREIADRTVTATNEHWGIYYYMSALYKLKKAGLLDQAISPETLVLLKKNLDWRTFVNEADMTIIKRPQNFYGIAFSIARLRTIMGWEDESASLKLLEKMTKHYETHSGQYGFSDETDGEGRFDRYSILLIAEVCQRYIETDLEPPEQLKKWLRNSVDFVFNIANTSGDGIIIGRSVGAYGDTAMLEILSAAASLNLLSKEEKDYAYAYTTRVVAKYTDFWYDKQMKSVNLWEKGRRTDIYRGKNRILGENLSLMHQIIYTTNQWSNMGYKNAVPKADLQQWLDKTQAKFKLTWYAKGHYDRALFTFRDKGHIINLPLISGGDLYHAFAPYFPVPVSSRMLAGSPEASYPQLIPQFTLADGTELLPTSFIRNITSTQKNDQYQVSYEQQDLNRFSYRPAIKDGRITVKTTYTFAPGSITRVDTYTPVIPLEVNKIAMQFASFSDKPTLEGTTVQFKEGDVTAIEVSGLTKCEVANVEANTVYRSPEGAMKNRVLCQTEKFTMDKPLTIKWAMKYK